MVSVTKFTRNGYMGILFEALLFVVTLGVLTQWSSFKKYGAVPAAAVVAIVIVINFKSLYDIFQLARPLWRSKVLHLQENTPASAQNTKEPVQALQQNDSRHGTVAGWLSYEVTCFRQAPEVVFCRGWIKSSETSDHQMGTFVSQSGGIRSIAFDHFPRISAVDNEANNYVATEAKVGSKRTSEEGALGFSLLPNLETPFTIAFTGVASTSKSFVRLLIPFADGGRGDSPVLEISVDNISIQS